MGILQRLGLKPTWSAPPPEVLAAPIIDSLIQTVGSMPVDELWRDQPHLRTVTSFIARSVASVSLHVYRRSADGGRERVRDGILPVLVRRANSTQLMYDVLYRAVMDLCLHDEFVWYIGETNGAKEILPIPPEWIINRQWSDPWTLESITINDDKTGAPIIIPADQIIRVTGYALATMKHGMSPVNALRDTLQEQLESASYRAQLWRNGPRLGGVILRPKDAPDWDSRERRRFKQSWQAQYSGRGSGAGGTPILEDGMTYQPQHLKAHDEEIVDVAKLSLQTVAGVYHVNPTMVGLLDNANYSNVREFRRGLYGDNLGPIIKQIEDTLNFFLLPALGEPADGSIYIEFNLDEKLRASFEEKAAVTSTAVGGPWMTVNEARAQNNMTAIDGGDDLIRPLNVGTAGDDSADQDEPPADDDGGGEDA